MDEPTYTIHGIVDQIPVPPPYQWISTGTFGNVQGGNVDPTLPANLHAPDGPRPCGGARIDANVEWCNQLTQGPDWAQNAEPHAHDLGHLVREILTDPVFGDELPLQGLPINLGMGEPETWSQIRFYGFGGQRSRRAGFRPLIAQPNWEPHLLSAVMPTFGLVNKMMNAHSLKTMLVSFTRGLQIPLELYAQIMNTAHHTDQYTGILTKLHPVAQLHGTDVELLRRHLFSVSQNTTIIFMGPDRFTAEEITQTGLNPANRPAGMAFTASLPQRMDGDTQGERCCRLFVPWQQWRYIFLYAAERFLRSHLEMHPNPLLQHLMHNTVVQPLSLLRVQATLSTLITHEFGHCFGWLVPTLNRRRSFLAGEYYYGDNIYSEHGFAVQQELTGGNVADFSGAGHCDPTGLGNLTFATIPSEDGLNDNQVMGLTQPPPPGVEVPAGFNLPLRKMPRRWFLIARNFGAVQWVLPDSYACQLHSGAFWADQRANGQGRLHSLYPSRFLARQEIIPQIDVDRRFVNFAPSALQAERDRLTQEAPHPEFFLREVHHQTEAWEQRRWREMWVTIRGRLVEVLPNTQSWPEIEEGWETD